MKYLELKEMLGNKETKKYAHNTYIVKLGNDEIGLKYHRTIVATFYPNGHVMLKNGGWSSKTTKDRLNWVISGRIFSTKGDWYYQEPTRKFRPIEYFNGMVLDRAGKCINYWENK